MAEHGQCFDVEFDLGGQPVGVEFVELAAGAESGVVDDEVDRRVRRRDPLGGRRLPVAVTEVGFEHLEAVVAVGDLLEPIAARATSTVGTPASPSRRAISAPIPEEAPVTSADVNG